MDARDLLAESVLSTKLLLARYLAGFDESSRTRQAAGLPNHVAWNLGHCALTMHRIANLFASDPPTMAGPLPERDFIVGDGTKGDGARFDSESVSFASQPMDEPGRYPSLVRAAAIYDAACERLAAVIRATPESKLSQMVSWGSGAQVPLWSVGTRMVFHNGFHTGQIADLRRALGFKSIFS
ncbi:MAG: DinB family protein [Phycisphaerales bacterium]